MHATNDTPMIAPEASTVEGNADDGRSQSVPTKPTAAMLADGARAGDVSVETAWRVYQAMINRHS